MTANQIAWWNIQEQIRSHMQNELNTRNANSITESLGNEQNRISRKKMENEFVLGTQGNDISQQQANTAAIRAAQDYDIGKKTVANQTQRNKQDYEIGTAANTIKAQDVKNQYLLGSVANTNQSIRNAQDYALGTRQQNTNVRLADASLLSAGAQVGKLNPAGVAVALTAPLMQKGVNTGAEKVVNAVKKFEAKPIVAPTKMGPVVPIKGAKPNVLNKVVSAPVKKPTPVVKGPTKGQHATSTKGGKRR